MWENSETHHSDSIGCQDFGAVKDSKIRHVGHEIHDCDQWH